MFGEWFCSYVLLKEREKKYTCKTIISLNKETQNIIQMITSIHSFNKLLTTAISKFGIQYIFYLNGSIHYKQLHAR